MDSNTNSNSYPYTFDTSIKYQDLINQIQPYPDHHVEKTIEHKLMCRVILKRTSGSKLYFFTVNVLGENLAETTLQIVVHNSIGSPEALETCKKITLGDVIGIVGYGGKTKVGELSVFAREVQILAPCIHDLPKEQYAPTDIECRFRQRYLDLIMNPKSRSNLITRSQIISWIRHQLDSQGFLEVETPILNMNYGGANAKPFITHHNEYNRDMFMRIAPELYLKQLVIGGLNKIYELGKQFRNEGVDATHNPEFTSIEIYSSPGDYNSMFELCEQIISGVVSNICGKSSVFYKRVLLDFTSGFKRIDFLDELSSKLEYDLNSLDFFNKDSLVTLENLIKSKGLICPPPLTAPRMLDFLCGEFIEIDCIQPTFVCNHPRIMSPLAKPHRTQPWKTERFELFILGKEYANAYTELNDPQIQRVAFEAQNSDKTSGDTEAQPPDMDFVKALEYGLPPTGGLGIGIDRLVMLVTGETSIREIISFPTMK
jgi:lysyl-tRNA synthetase class 2